MHPRVQKNTFPLMQNVTQNKWLLQHPTLWYPCKKVEHVCKNARKNACKNACCICCCRPIAPPPPPPPHLTPADGQMSRCACNKPRAKTFAVYLCASYEQHTCLREHIIRYGFSPKRCPPVTLRAKRAVNWRDAVADKGCSVRAPVHLSIRERRALTRFDDELLSNNVTKSRCKTC